MSQNLVLIVWWDFNLVWPTSLNVWNRSLKCFPIFTIKSKIIKHLAREVIKKSYYRQRINNLVIQILKGVATGLFLIWDLLSIFTSYLEINKKLLLVKLADNLSFCVMLNNKEILVRDMYYTFRLTYTELMLFC